MSKPWFDAKTGLLLLDEYVAQSPSFRLIMEDCVVTQAELTEQGMKTVSLLKRLEGLLSAEARDVATDALCELAVLYAVQRKFAQAQR